MTTTPDRYPAPRPTPHRHKPGRPSLSRYLMTIAAVSAVLALGIWGALSIQMSAGADPAIGNQSANSDVTQVSRNDGATASTATGSGDDGASGDDESGYGYYDDGYGNIVVAPAPQVQTTAPAAPAQTQAPAPVQTSVS